MLKYACIGRAFRLPLKPLVRFLSLPLESERPDIRNESVDTSKGSNKMDSWPKEHNRKQTKQTFITEHQSYRDKFELFSRIHRLQSLMHGKRCISEPQDILRLSIHITELQTLKWCDDRTRKSFSLSNLIQHINPRHYSYFCMTLVDAGYTFSSSKDDVKTQILILKRLNNGNDSDYACFLSCMTDGTDEKVRQSFLQVYSIQMCTYTISSIMNKGRNKDTERFLKLLLERLLIANSLPLDTDISALTDKEEFLVFFRMLNRFKLRRNRLPILRPMFVRHLIPFVLESKFLISRRIGSSDLEAFLKILYRYLSFSETNDPRIIMKADAAFLYFMAKMPGSKVEILLAYTMAMFPQSRSLFTSLNLISKNSNGKDYLTHNGKMIPNCNIRDELCLVDKMPSMKIIQLIYDRLFLGHELTKWDVGALFSRYLDEVRRIQSQDTLSDHPFCRNNHSSLILESFIRYIITWLKKPVFAYNRVIVFLNSVYCSELKSRYLSILISDLSRRSLSHACSLLIRAEMDTKVDSDAFFSIINEMMRLGEGESAKKYYAYACRSQRISKSFTDSQIAKICVDFKWDAPKYWLINRLSNDPKVISEFENEKSGSSSDMTPAWLQKEKQFNTDVFISFLDRCQKTENR